MSEEKDDDGIELERIKFRNMDFPICPVCSMQKVEPNGVRITNMQKFLCAPDPCPECMKEWAESMREFGRKFARSVDEAIMREFEKTTGSEKP